MCNEYERFITWEEYCRMMEGLAWEIPKHQSELDLPQAARTRISDLAPVVRATGGGNVVELASMSFGFPPQGKGGPVFNYRSDGRSFANSKRCLIPASAFFEFTGTKYPKTKHRFTMQGEPFFAIAGLWREAVGNHPPSFTMLTTEPGPDVAPFHNRQIVVLKPADWRAWLDLSKPEGELLMAPPAGTLKAEVVQK
jgi:putative SOS response-associated peptidase YedK